MTLLWGGGDLQAHMWACWVVLLCTCVMSVDKNASVCETNQCSVTQFAGGKSASVFPLLCVKSGSNLSQSSDGISCVLIFSRQYDRDISYS